MSIQKDFEEDLDFICYPTKPVPLRENLGDEDCYPLKCVFCHSNRIVRFSDYKNSTQTCGKCKKTFYAPDYYEIKDRKLYLKEEFRNEKIGFFERMKFRLLGHK